RAADAGAHDRQELLRRDAFLDVVRQVEMAVVELVAGGLRLGAGEAGGEHEAQGQTRQSRALNRPARREGEPGGGKPTHGCARNSLRERTESFSRASSVSSAVCLDEPGASYRSDLRGVNTTYVETRSPSHHAECPAQAAIVRPHTIRRVYSALLSL